MHSFVGNIARLVSAIELKESQLNDLKKEISRIRDMNMKYDNDTTNAAEQITAEYERKKVCRHSWIITYSRMHSLMHSLTHALTHDD